MDTYTDYNALQKMTFTAFSEWWFATYAEKKLRERSIERLHQFTQRTCTAIGDLEITQIKALHIQFFIDSLAAPGVNCRTGGGLSPKTIRGYLNFISDVMLFAWRMELITTNPCERVLLPQLMRREPDIYTEEQTREFLSCLSNAPAKYQAFYNIALYGGLRRGEILGLNWTDIDFTNCVITVRRNVQYTKRKGIYFEAPKTHCGYRVLKMPASLFVYIHALRKNQLNYFRDKGIRWSEETTLFIDASGGPMHPNTPYNWLKRFCSKNDLPFYGIHQFRHLNASLLISSGTNPRTVAYALGHAQVSTTLNIYSHAFAHSQATASEAIGNWISEKMSAQSPI